MLYNKKLAIAIIFSILILASLFFSLYGISNKTDQGVLIKSDMNLIYYIPEKSISILSNSTETIVLENGNEYQINGLESNYACSYKNDYIGISGYYKNNPSLTILYDNGTYSIYELKLENPPTSIYCLNNEIIFSGINPLYPYIGFINFNNTSSNTIPIYMDSIYFGTPSEIHLFNNTEFLTFNNNYIIVYDENKSYFIEYPNSTSIYNMYIYNGKIYIIGSININGSTYGLVSPLFGNYSYTIGLNNYQGFIEVGADKLHGYSLLYRPYVTFAYLITVTQNKYLYTALIGMSYPFTLYNEGSYNKGIWLTGSMNISNQNYQVGLYINGTINGNIGYKPSIAYIVTSIPIVSKGFMYTTNTSFKVNSLNTTKINISFNKIFGNSIKTSSINVIYLNFVVNRYIIFGEYTFISILIGLVIYCVLAKSYKWSC
ncbi:MAG: hypothetical protein ACP5U0_02550 [Caldisphaera sp.]